MIYIGVDPGLSGGVALLNSAGKVVMLARMPVMSSPVKGKNMVNGHALYSILAGCADMYPKAAIEQVNAMPKQGVSSSFSFGQSYGIAIGVLCSIGASYEFVRPQAWKKEFGLIKKDKKHSIAEAKRRWPDRAATITSDGIAEALLIAEHLRTKQNVAR